MKIARYALYGLGGLVLVLAVALTLVAMFFDPNAHKTELQRLVLARTGRELALPGELKLKVFPWVAVDIGRATLGNAPGFGPEPMVEIEHARLGVKLLPLLHRELEIGDIRLDAPTIRLAVDAGGHDNWADLKGHAAAPAAGEAAPGTGTTALPRMSVAEVQIVNGTVVYTDRAAGSETAVHGLTLKTGAVAYGQPFDLEFSGMLQKGKAEQSEAQQGNAQQGKALDVGLQLKARVVLDPDSSRYQLASPHIGLQLRGAGLPAAGLDVDLALERIDADLKAQTLQLTGLEMHAAGAVLKGTFSGEQIVDAPSLRGTVQLADVSLREVLQKLGVELPATRDPAAFGRVGFDATLRASARALMLDDLRARLDGTTLTGHAGISDLAAKALAFDLKLDRINADHYLAAAPKGPAAAAPAAKPAASAPVAIPVELIRSLNVHGSLNVGSAVFAGIQYSNLHIGVNAAGGRLRIFPSEAQMYGGQYHGDIGLDASGAVPRVSFDEHVTGVDFAPLFHDMFDTTHVSGRGNGAIKAVATGADTAALLHTLTGTLEFHVDNGAFEGTDLWYEIRLARALLKQQPMPAHTGPARTAFTAVSATGRINNGVVANDDLIAALQYLQVKGRGTADIGAGTLDYHLDVTVLKMPEEGSDGADMKDMAGLSVPVQVTGSFGAPKVRPDLAGLLKARVQQEIDKHKDELKQQLQDKLQDKLKGLFGH